MNSLIKAGHPTALKDLISYEEGSIANMWWAVFADVGVMILAVLNAMRMLIVEKN